MRILQNLIERIILNSKWLMVIPCLGLIIVMCIYEWIYTLEVIHLVRHHSFTLEHGIIPVIQFVDSAMIIGLVYMIYSGLFLTHVTKPKDMHDKNISSGTLKIKMSSALIGISSIHLLQTFVDIKNNTWDFVSMQLCIHVAFIVGAYFLAKVESMHVKDAQVHHDMHNKHK